MQELFSLFEEFGYPYFRQGSMSDSDYNPDFFTFWNIDTPNDSFYDNDARRYIEYIQVGFYTNNANNIYKIMDDFINIAKQRGFVVEGRARDADSGRADFFGRICYLRIIHKVLED